MCIRDSIVVLVVAADDGIKPQTVEAIKHAKAAKVPIIVAINKCDLPEKNISKIKNEMMQYELIAEDLSGDTLFVEVSALKKINLDKLKESILLQSEIIDLKASYTDSAKGVVIESKIDKGKGPVSTVLISNGKLKRGDYFICGDTWGKVRAMINHEGKTIDEALTSMPVEILGMNSSAYAGAEFVVTEDEDEAKKLSEFGATVEEISVPMQSYVAAIYTPIVIQGIARSMFWSYGTGVGRDDQYSGTLSEKILRKFKVKKTENKDHSSKTK